MTLTSSPEEFAAAALAGSGLSAAEQLRIRPAAIADAQAGAIRMLYTHGAEIVLGPQRSEQLVQAATGRLPHGALANLTHDLVHEVGHALGGPAPAAWRNAEEAVVETLAGSGTLRSDLAIGMGLLQPQHAVELQHAPVEGLGPAFAPLHELGDVLTHLQIDLTEPQARHAHRLLRGGPIQQLPDRLAARAVEIGAIDERDASALTGALRAALLGAGA